ncbi:SUMO1 sentrin specific peptidase 1, partial [Coemansia thaxteri]
MAASNKRTRSLESLDMPGGFPERRKPNKRRADINGGLIGGSGEWLLSCVAATVSYAKSWFSSTPAKTEIRHSGDSTHTQSAAVKERIEGSQPRVRSRKSKKQKRRKALVGHEYSQGSLQSKSRRLVKEYTTPSSVWSVRDSPARALEHPTRKFSGAYSGNGFYSARSPAYSEGVSAWSQVSTEERQEDTRSILSIDSSVPDNNEYRYTFGEQRSNASARRFTFESSVSPSPFSSAAATPVKGRWTSSSASGAKRSEPADLWMAQLRKKIQETLSVTSPASRIATPAYDRVCREQNDFEARLAQAKQKMAFALPANAKTVIAQTQLPGFTAEINNVPVTARDVDTLGDGKWLNDEVINFYMQLIMERSEQTPGMPTVHAFNTFFYSTLRDQGYVRVKRWTRRVKLFEKDLVIVP